MRGRAGSFVEARWRAVFRRFLGARTRRAPVCPSDRLKAGRQPFAVLLLLVMAGAIVVAKAQEKPRLPWWERGNQPLSPEIEKALGEIESRMTSLRRKDIEGHMEEVIESLVTTTGLAEEAKRKALRDAAAAALEETMKPFPAAVTRTNRIRLTANGAIPTVAAMASWSVDLAALARLVLGCKLPDEQEVWTKALKENLSAEQLAKWQVVVTAKRKARDEAITGLLRQWQDSYREGGTRLIEMRIKAMSSEINLDKDRVRKLREAATAVIDRICKDEVDRATESLRFEIEKRFQETLARSRGTFNGYAMEMAPAEDAGWRRAVAEILKPEELAKWERRLAEEKAKFDKEIPNLLKGAIDQMSVQWKASADLEADSVILALGLPEERAKSLEPAKQSALERVEKAYIRTAKTQLDQVDPAYREQILKQGRFYVQIQESDLPQNDPLFKTALQNLLTPEENQRLAAAKEERKARRERALGHLMISELDKKTAFTATQREKLLPIAERLMNTAGELSPASRYNNGFDMGLERFFSAGLSATDQELKVILDPVQLARWRETCKAGTAAGDRQRRIAFQPLVSAPSKEPQRSPEPEEVEIQLSDHLVKKADAERKRLLEIMMLEAEDATRVAALPSAISARLGTAARGAVERTLGTWKSNTERSLRSTTQGATPANIKQRLAGMEGYYYERNDNSTVTSQTMWKKTVAAALDEAQRKAWEKEIDTRKDYRWNAIAAAVLAEFDRRIGLTPVQCTQLEPMLTKVIKEYMDDIEGYFSSASPWYLQPYSVLLPVAGLPEKGMKALLSKKQWERWSGEDLASAMNYWENIEQNHKSRKERAK